MVYLVHTSGMVDLPFEVDVAQAENPVVLSLDVGSSSARAGLVDVSGRRVAGSLVQTRYHLDTTADGGAVLDPHALVAVVDGLIDGVLAEEEYASLDIGAVAISTVWHSLLGLGADGTPVSPIYMWADTRATGSVELLARRLDPDAYHQRTGCILHPSYWPAKLIWIQGALPNQWERAERWISIGDYLLLHVIGEATTSTSMASGTGLFDETRLTWDDATLAAVELPDSKLSPLGDRPVSGLRPEYADRWPRLRDVPWFPALGDGACSNLGSGAAGKDRLGLTVGTTGAMRLLWEGAPVPLPKGIWLYRLDSRRVLLGGALSEGGNLFEWARSSFRLPEGPALNDALSRLEPDSHGLTWLPFLAGERSPGWRGEARGVLAGMTLDTTGLEILRAGMEAVAERFAVVMQAIEQAMPGERVIVASGGALLQDPVWLQIMADVLGREVLVPREMEASFRGAALAALERIGAITDLATTAAEVLEDGPRFTPNPANHAIYQKAVRRQQALYDRVLGPPA